MSNVTKMGWNQVVYFIDTDLGTTLEAVKVADYNVGLNQGFEVPPLVTGVTDRITWSKALVEAGGTISAPLMQTFGNTILNKAFTRDNSGVLGSFTIGSTAHVELTGAQVQSATITADSGSYIQVSSEIFGTAAGAGFIPYSGYGTYTGGYNQVATTTTVTYTNPNSQSLDPDPAANDTAFTSWDYAEQIPMFDQVTGVDLMMPANLGVPISITLSVNNNLLRNYVLGSETGLDAWSISSGQRDLTGTITWQSLGTGDGDIGQVVNAGLVDPGAISLAFSPLLTFDLTDAYVLWGAQPPVASPQDRITASAPFQIISSTYGFIPIAIA